MAPSQMFRDANLRFWQEQMLIFGGWSGDKMQFALTDVFFFAQLQAHPLSFFSCCTCTFKLESGGRVLKSSAPPTLGSCCTRLVYGSLPVKNGLHLYLLYHLWALNVNEVTDRPSTLFIFVHFDFFFSSLQPVWSCSFFINPIICCRIKNQSAYLSRIT